MNIAFWSEEDGCGTTSSMAAVASVCTDAWNMKTVLLQSRNQNGDLYRKLESPFLADAVHEESAPYTLDGLEFLVWQEKNQKLTKRMIQDSMVTVVKGQMYYLPQGGYMRPQGRQEEQKKLMWRVVCQAGQLADLTFIDCGSGEDELAEYLRMQADVVVVNLLQERQSLDAYFKGRHMFHGKTVYLIDQYQPCSVYNRENIHRMYRLEKEEVGVILHDPFFRHASERGRVERFVRRHVRCSLLDQQFCFMQELMRTAYLILKAGGAAE